MKSKLLLFFLCALNFLACEEPDEGFVQNYEIEVVDIFTDQPIQGAKVAINWNIGAGYTLHGVQNDEGFTDINGRVSLRTAVDMDSVAVFLEEDPFLEERHIHQMLFIDKEGYELKELEQDTPIMRWRPFLNEDQLVTAKLYKSILADVVMIDEAPRRTEDIFFNYLITQNHPSFAFNIYGGNTTLFFLDEPDTMKLGLVTADQVDYRIDYALTTYDPMADKLDTFFQSFYEFVGDASVPSQMIEIKF